MASAPASTPPLHLPPPRGLRSKTIVWLSGVVIPGIFVPAGTPTLAPWTSPK
jgi:hypothetical protein